MAGCQALLRASGTRSETTEAELMTAVLARADIWLPGAASESELTAGAPYLPYIVQKSDCCIYANIKK